MTSEIRANTLKNRVGLGTVSFTNTGPVVSGIVTANTLRLPDATSGSLGRVQFGNGLHLSLYHNGSNSFLVNNNGYLSIQSQAGVNGIFIARNAEVNLYYGPSVRLQTSSSGVTINRDLDVDGHTNLDNVSVAGVSTFSNSVKFVGTTSGRDLNWNYGSNKLNLADNVLLGLGNSDDLLIHHTGSTGYIKGQNGNLYIQSDQVVVIGNQSASSAGLKFTNGGAAELFFNGNKKFETTSAGVQVTGSLNVTTTMHIPDGSVGLQIGNSNDLRLYHDGSHSFIRDTGTGGLRITTDSFNVLNSANNEAMITATEDGAVKLYYDHNLRLETDTSRTIFRGGAGIGVYGDSGSNHNGQISIHPTGSAVYSNLFFYNAAGNSYASIIGHAGGTLFFTGGTNSPLRHRVNGTGFHSFQDGNTERVRITVGGQVNIGNSSGVLSQTTFKAQIETATNKLISFGAAEHDDLSDEGAGIIFSRPSDGSAKISGIFQHSNQSLGVASRGGLTFHTGGTSFYSAADERLRIASGGQVIIGDDDTDKANGHFDDLIVGANASTTETHGITIVCGNAATNGGIAFSDGSAGGADAYRGMISYQHNDNHMQFRTNAVERLRIDSSGNFNLGLTASPVSSSTEQGVYLAGANSTQSVISSDVTPVVINRVGTGGNDRNCIEFRNNGVLRGTVGAIGGSNGIFFQSATSEALRITSEGYLHLGNTAHGTNKVGGQAVTGQDLDAVVKLYSSNSNLWLAQLRGDNTTNNGVFLRSGTSSSNYTLYATGYDENNPHLIVRGDGAVLIGESTQSGMQRGDVVVHASVQSGNVNEPAVIHRNSSGEIIYFEHYFSCTKGGAGNSHTVNQDIIQIQNIGNFHQAVFHCWMGVRLQGQGDSYTRPATWQTGVNRFNGGSTIQKEENWISADSAVQTYANLHVGNANSTSYYVRMNWPAGTYGSSFASGKIMGTFCADSVPNSDITFAYGRT